MKLKSFTSNERHFILEQVDCRTKAKKKLPFYVEKKCFYTKRSLEQATAEAVAKFKATLFKGNTFYDLSGGLGIDDYWLSQNFKNVISIDCDEELNEIVEENFRILKTTNIKRETAFAQDFDFSVTAKDDLIYLDPDRRDSHGRRQYLPENHSPNLYEILKKVPAKTKVVIKLSPMVDISLLLKEISTISTIWVISHKQENKEILLECNGEKPLAIFAVEIDKKTKILKKADLENETIEINYNLPYLYIPSPSITKSKNGATLAAKHQLTRINNSFQFLFSNTLINNFMGRSFKVSKKIAFKPKTIKKELKELGIENAEMLARNFYHSSEDLHKILRIKKGGKHLLVFTNDIEKQPIVFICELNSQNLQA